MSCWMKSNYVKVYNMFILNMTMCNPFSTSLKKVSKKISNMSIT